MSFISFAPIYMSHAALMAQGSMLHAHSEFSTPYPLLEPSKYQQAIEGIQRLLSKQFPKHTIEAPIVWQEGSSKLHHYGAPNNPPVLLVPSLINKAYIFDIAKSRSAAQTFAENGFSVYLLDWGEPSDAEIDFDVSAYTEQRLFSAIEYLNTKHKTPIHITGYCMGGMMAMAAAQILPNKIASLSLIATPWDFHTRKTAWDSAMKHIQQQDYPTTSPTIMPGVFMHNLLYMMDPNALFEKYARLQTIETNSEAEASFIERENWLHDHVAITSNVVADCLLHWGVENQPMQNKWHVQKQAIKPQEIQCPTFISIAEFDSVIPEASSTSLLAYIPDRKHHRISSGHIGMVAGTKAVNNLWLPLAKWMKNH